MTQPSAGTSKRSGGRDVVLHTSMSLDGSVGSDCEHPGIPIPEGAELKQWKLDLIGKAGAHLPLVLGRGEALFDRLPESRLNLVQATSFPSGSVVHVYRPQRH